MLKKILVLTSLFFSAAANAQISTGMGHSSEREILSCIGNNGLEVRIVQRQNQGLMAASFINKVPVKANAVSIFKGNSRGLIYDGTPMSILIPHGQTSTPIKAILSVSGNKTDLLCEKR